MNQFSFHTPVHQLTDYVEDRLPLAERLQIESHLSACAACSGKVVRLKQLRDSTHPDVSEATSPTFLARIKQFFRVLARHQTAPLERQRIQAVRHFDSLERTGSFGVRSGKPGTRQILFSDGENQIDLRIEPAGTLWIVAGQILGESVVRGRALLQSPAITEQTDLNELSEFTFSSVEAGTYRMILDLENVEVEIDELRIGR